MTAIALNSPDRLTRAALVAVELVDPVSLSLVYRGIAVTAQGLAGSPIVSWSGRFVWLAEGGSWPTSFKVDPGRQPFESVDHLALPRPANLNDVPAVDRLLRITLRPTVAYPFADGVTAVRGRIRETASTASPVVAGAEVWLRWANEAPAGPPFVDAPLRARTNQFGEFATFLRLPTKARPTVEQGNLLVRIVVSRGNQVREKAERLPDGRITDLPDALAWSALTPV